MDVEAARAEGRPDSVLAKREMAEGATGLCAANAVGGSGEVAGKW